MTDVGVVGAGASGSLVACHVLAMHHSATVTLYDRSGSFGPGLAYSTPCDQHLLNVPAGRMSAIPDDPGHFLRWGHAQGLEWTGGSFVPRHHFGRYIRELLDQHDAEHPGRLRRVAWHVTQARPQPDRVRLLGHERAQSQAHRHVVLALGNFPPSDPHPGLAQLPPTAVIRDPWDRAAWDRALPDQQSLQRTALLIGTGLTMFDVVATLRARGFTGPIIAVSRRGLLPQPHRSPARPSHHGPPRDIEAWPTTMPALLAHVRRLVENNAKHRIDWRDTISSLRSVTPLLWQRMAERDRASFLRHARPYWESVRHRAAPAIDALVQDLLLTERMHVLAGRLSTLESTGPDAQATLTLRGGTTRHIDRCLVVNCTGPQSDCTRTTQPLLRQLVDDAIALPDPLGLGLCSDAQGRLRAPSPGDGRPDHAGSVHDRLWVVGPLRRGDQWECTAVPEIRVEARALAHALVNTISAEPDAPPLDAPIVHIAPQARTTPQRS